MKKLIGIFTLTLASTTAFASAPLADCSANTRPQVQCMIQLSSLRPTQFSVGMKSVMKKAKKIGKKDSSEYKEYIESHPVPVVIGNGGQFYMLDHHHLSRALYELGKTATIATVVQNWNNVPTPDFWPKMLDSHYAYLNDENGNARTIAELPLRIQDLKDNPYRSLSGEVEDDGGFIKGGVFFIEFVWADFFRPRISLDLIENDFKTAVKKATALAHSSEAANMPGYSPTPVDNDDGN